MQLLYQADLRGEPVEEIKDGFLKDSNYIDETKDWAIELALNAWSRRDEADQIIKEYSIDWDLDRINPVDKSLLRLAIYEIKHTETPVNVILNEAIEISKQFSTDESPKFLNGILGNFVKKDVHRDH